MATTVIIESPPGTIWPTRQFDPGQSIRIGGRVQTAFGIPVIGYAVMIDIYKISGEAFDSIHVQDRTNFLGDYWVDVVLPVVNASANIRVVVEFGITAPDVVNIPIGIGTVAAPPPPGPEKDFLTKVGEIVKYAAIGAGIIGGIYLLSIFKKRGKE